MPSPPSAAQKLWSIHLCGGAPKGGTEYADISNNRWYELRHIIQSSFKYTHFYDISGALQQALMGC
jgi:hypothetical protein